LPLVGLVVSAAITAEFPQGCNLPYFIFGATKVKLELFFEKISHQDHQGTKSTLIIPGVLLFLGVLYVRSSGTYWYIYGRQYGSFVLLLYICP